MPIARRLSMSLSVSASISSLLGSTTSPLSVRRNTRACKRTRLARERSACSKCSTWYVVRITPRENLVCSLTESSLHLQVEERVGAHVEGEADERQGRVVYVHEVLVQGLHVVVHDAHAALVAEKREAVQVARAVEQHVGRRRAAVGELNAALQDLDHVGRLVDVVGEAGVDGLRPVVAQHHAGSAAHRHL